MSLLDNIQVLCSSKNTTLIGLEREIGLGRGTIRNWDKSSPSIDKLQKVADYFDVSVDHLITTLDQQIISTIKRLTRINDDEESYFPEKTERLLSYELERLSKEYWDVPLDEYLVNPIEMIRLIRESPLSDAFKQDFFKSLNIVKANVEKRPIVTPFAGAGGMDVNVSDFFNTKNTNQLTSKEERDIAKDLEKIISDMESDNALAFCGESPEDEADRELLKASLLYSMRLAKQMAKKKFTPKKYRKED